MNRIRVLTLGCFVFAVCTYFVQAQNDDLKAILAKSVEAHGGAKALTKYKALSTTGKGTMKIMGDTYNTNLEMWMLKPNKFKQVISLEKDGKSIDVTRVFDGKTFWLSVMGKTQEVKDEKILKELEETLQSEGNDSLVDFQKKPYELSAIGESKVKGKDAIGIRVSKKGQRDISYYFDKKTFLVLKTESRTLDPLGQKEVTQEKIITAYQDKQGMKVARKMEVLMDGEFFMEFELNAFEAMEKLDDSMFAKP